MTAIRNMVVGDTTRVPGLKNTRMRWVVIYPATYP